MKIQIPKMTSFGINQYGKLELQVTPEFLALWEPIVEEYRGEAKFPWTENPGPDGIFRVKVDESTHIFDGKSELIRGEIPAFAEREVTCIIDILKVYNFKGSSGLTCRVHQMKIHDPEYLFT
jgi:hypothetical protein